MFIVCLKILKEIWYGGEVNNVTTLFLYSFTIPSNTIEPKNFTTPCFNIHIKFIDIFAI